MKMKYETPSAEKISFNYRDQVVAASSETGGNGDSFAQNVMGAGSPVCGSGGIVDRALDYLGWSICD